ncbi:hypothetical protein AALA61_14890 [Oscillospiraceae bacterium 42-9]
MMLDLKEFQKKVREQEEQRVGDIYAECEKRGCERSFLQAFDTRAWLFPVEQAKAFLSSRNNPSSDQASFSDYIRQYRIFLEVLIEKRPNHEKQNEWKKALQVMENEN